MHVHPQKIYCSEKTAFAMESSKHHSGIDFTEHSHSPLMKVEHSLYKRQLIKWINAYNNNNWVHGAVIVQAIVNSLPLS
jgi:hypothetical protein